MHRAVLAVALLAFLAGNPVLAADVPIPVVTTTTDLKALVEAIGGQRVTVRSIVPATLDAETYEPRPRDLQALQTAQLVARVGLDYDLWFDRLLAQSGNPDVAFGRPGYIDASTGIALLEVRSMTLGTQTGHAHGVGNPHYWLDPANGEIMTGSIIEGLERIDPDGSPVYRANRAAFLATLRERIETWRARLAPLAGRAILAYHNTWPYFARRMRLNVAAVVEPRPGIPPSPSHLGELIRRIKSERIPLIIKTPFEPEQVPRMLADRTGIRVVVLAPSVGALPAAVDYLSLFEGNVHALARAMDDAGLVR